MENKIHILKTFPYDQDRLSTNYFNEVRVGLLSHPNIIGMISCYEETNLIINSIPAKTSSILMEFAPFGDFYDLLITHKISLSEQLARTYFHQLIDALEYLHMNKITHMDLKLNNLLLGENFELKVADFDLSHLEGDTNIKSRGSKYYRAPEVIIGCCNHPMSADIFSAGILLFAFKSRGFLPHLENQTYKGIDLYGLMRNDNEKFWEVHSGIQKNQDFYSPEFRELFNLMTKTKPHERATIQDIKKSAWYNGPVYSVSELKEIMHKKFVNKKLLS